MIGHSLRFAFFLSCRSFSSAHTQSVFVENERKTFLKKGKDKRKKKHKSGFSRGLNEPTKGSKQSLRSIVSEVHEANNSSSTKEKEKKCNV